MNEISFSFLFLLICHLQFTSTNSTRSQLIHHCQVEPFIDPIIINGCSTRQILIETTHCAGQCYSEHRFRNSWESISPHFQHEEQINCCLATKSVPHQIQIICDDNRIEIIRYRNITQCRCQSCPNKCLN